MEPSYREGDFVLLMSYLLREPKIGHTAIIETEEGDKKLLLKRIAGVLRKDGKSSYWIEGDNAQDSRDSRAFGWIPRKRIKGRAFVFKHP